MEVDKSVFIGRVSGIDWRVVYEHRADVNKWINSVTGLFNAVKPSEVCDPEQVNDEIKRLKNDPAPIF
ncbi:hypothetical protein ABK905_14610 [Acerihabitans sp. KWT182]|uniref:PH domain-containing protein n=1 Tax=Acerihabitans sp. KWT182 TaxID=3157919 RepID=A0AAU7Q4M1_9GAMM